MITKSIEFFGKNLNVNVSSVIPLKYAQEFNKDLNSLLNKITTLAMNNENGELDFSSLDFGMLNECNEVAYTMLKYANNNNFNYKNYEEYLSDYTFLDLSLKSIEIITKYIETTNKILPKRTELKKNNHKRRKGK